MKRAIRKHTEKHIQAIDVLPIVILGILFICACYFCLRRRIIIDLGHSKCISISTEETYKNIQNSTASFCNLFSCKDISEYIQYENTFEFGKIGEYHNKVSVSYEKQYQEKTWKLKVRDAIAPEIRLIGGNELIMYLGDNYDDPGVIATDNYDGDISNDVATVGDVNVNVFGSYEITYRVADSSKNVTKVKRDVIVRKLPVIIDHNSSTLQKDEGLLGDRKIAFYREVEKYIADNKLDVAIGYYDFNTGNQYTYRSDQTFYGASLVKAATAMYAYDKGKLTSEIRELSSKAISVSDNDSHKSLVDILGQSKIKSYAQKMGAKHYMTGSSAHYYGDTTVNDQLCIWKYLWTNIDSMRSGSELKSYFANTYYNNIQKGHGVKTYHKAGWYGKVIHDVGVVMDGDNPYLLVVLTNHGSSGAKIIQNIAKIVQKY